jgi:hypothetical protein
MKDESENSGCLLAVFALAMAAPAYIWRGYVLSLLWGWFMVPTFSLPRLSITAAIGIALTVGMLTSCSDDNNDKTQAEIFTGLVATSFILPLMVLGVGWVVTWFM